MPNESAQPFDKTDRDPQDERLVGEVLGAGTREEMEELTDGVQGQVTESGAMGLDLSENEQKEVQRKEITPKQRRRQYIGWAEDIGKDEEWVDRTFIFETDGRVKVEGNLPLGKTGISE